MIVLDILELTNMERTVALYSHETDEMLWSGKPSDIVDEYIYSPVTYIDIREDVLAISIEV